MDDKVVDGFMVRAPLPITDNQPGATLKPSGEVTFDPLGVAAILHNPRAHLSVARLYTQLHQNTLTWPHTMMFGAALIPLKVLVEHFDPSLKHFHPAITALFAKETEYLTMLSDLGDQQFPMDIGNAWFKEAVVFPPSSEATRDIMIVNIQQKIPPKAKHVSRLILNVISLLTGLIHLGGMILAVIMADFWAIPLFFFYGIHWLCSLAISIRPPIHPKDWMILPNGSQSYAIYNRAPAGSVIFKGRRDALETWARRTWDFRADSLCSTLHWAWMLSGSLAALCSIACMVNMRGYMQLAFLGLLVFSSLAEIVASRAWGHIDDELLRHGSYLVAENATKITSIVRATVEAEPVFRLQGLDWIKMRMLPDHPVFREVITMLARINNFQCQVEAGEVVVSGAGPGGHEDIETARNLFKEGLRVSDGGPGGQIQEQVDKSLEIWWQRLKKHTQDT